MDVTVLDHEMPIGDGQSIARLICNERNVPIVFLSGNDPEEFESIVGSLAAPPTLVMRANVW